VLAKLIAQWKKVRESFGTNWRFKLFVQDLAFEVSQHSNCESSFLLSQYYSVFWNTLYLHIFRLFKHQVYAYKGSRAEDDLISFAKGAFTAVTPEPFPPAPEAVKEEKDPKQLVLSCSCLSNKSNLYHFLVLKERSNTLQIIWLHFNYLTPIGCGRILRFEVHYEPTMMIRRFLLFEILWFIFP